MGVAYVLGALLLFTPRTSAGRYGGGSPKAIYGRQYYPSINYTATDTPTTSLQLSTSADSSSYQSSLFSSSSSSIVTSQLTSGNAPVEPTATEHPPPIPSDPPDHNDIDPPPDDNVSWDPCDTDFGCPSSSASSLFQSTVSAIKVANGSTPGLPAPILPSVALTSEQAACTGLLTSSVTFVTLTTTIVETITLPSSAPNPDPTYITPVQPCLLTTSSETVTFAFITFTSSGESSFTVTPVLTFVPPPPPPRPLTSTIVVTKKTSVVVVATDSANSVHYSDPGGPPQPSPPRVPPHAPNAPVTKVPSSPSISPSMNLPPSSKAAAPLPKPEPAVPSNSQQTRAPPSPSTANQGYSAVPAVMPGGSPTVSNPEEPPSRPEAPSNPNVQGPTNANPGTPSKPDAPQSNIGASPPAPTSGLRGVTTLTINNVPVVVEADSVFINSQTLNAAFPTSVVVDGQVFQIDNSAIIVPGSTVPLPPDPASVTLAGQVFSIDPARPSQLVGTGATIPIPQTPQGSPVTVAGQTFTLNPTQIIGASTTMGLPAIPLSPAIPTAVTVEGVTVSVGPSLAVIGSSTYSITAGQTPKTVIYEGQTISIGPGGLGFVGTSVALPQESPTISAITADGLELSIGPSVAILSGTTYRIGAGASSTVVTVGGEVLTIGPSGVIMPTQTIAPLATVKPSIVTAGGLTFSIEPSAAIISGTTYQIGPGASSRVLTIGGETITLGPSGVILPTQTIPPLATVTPSAVTADSLTFSVESGGVIISGTTYRIGSGATPTTLILGTETVRIGPNGIALPSTTISPPSQTTSGTQTIPESAASSRVVWRTRCAIITTFLATLLLI